jgi:hypothetical protein
MATASFTLPPNELLQQAQLNQLQMQQEQEQLQALQMKGIGAKPLDTGTFQVVNFDPIIQAMTQKRLKAEIEAKQKKQLDLTGAYSAKLADELKGYHARKAGETQVTPLLDESGQPVTNQLPGDPRAFRSGLSSQFPEVRKLAEGDQKQYNDVYGKLVDKASLSSGVKSLQGDQDPTQLAAKPDIVMVGDLPYKKEENGTLTPVNHKGYTQEPDARGGVANRNTFTNKVESRGGQTITIGGAAADTEFLKTSAEQLAKDAPRLETALGKGLRALQSVEQASQKGAFQGPVSKYVQLAVGIGQELGLNSSQTQQLLSNTEIINGGMGRFVLEAIKATGTNPSNTDLIFTKETAGGKELSPDGLAALIRAARADFANEGILHNQRVDKLKEKIPSVELARIKMPEFANLDPKRQKELGLQSAHNVMGFEPGSGDYPLFMPRERAGAVEKPPAALSPAERRARLKALGIPE